MLETAVVNDATPIKDKPKPQFDNPQKIIQAFEDFLANNAEYQTTDLDQFIASFNARFVNFEKDSSLKLDILALAEKHSISCTGATLLLGLWFEKNTDRHPIYLVQLSASWDKPSKYSHTVIFLPNESFVPEISASDQSVSSDIQDLLGKGEFVEYLVEGGLAKRIPPPHSSLKT